MSDFITNGELRMEAERLCDENEHLQAENARLRSYLSDDVENARMIMCENSRLREQNAKLRELVARVERARRNLCDAYPDAELLNCEECPAWSACGGDLMDRMRELGVEVD